jgi:dethiobiotin synthetase
VKHGYFITGTGTGVGKTFVTTSLARRALALNKRVFAFKPIETGCQTIGEDQRALVQAAGSWQAGDLTGIYRFAPPLAPWVAAKAAHVEISFKTILTALERGSNQADLTLVEGAGGWRVPISDREDMSTLARACGFPILVVATAGLGTINHSLLTVEAIERDHQTVAALILSELPTDDVQMTESNIEQLRARWSGVVVRLAADPTVLDQFV